MKKLIYLSFLLILITKVSIAQPLSGNYIIDPVSQPPTGYPSFGAAVSALVQYGVNGPVTFFITAGTYGEQVDIPAIAGASSVNTILFRAANGVASSVTLQYAATAVATNYTLRLNAARFIDFSNITIKATGSSYGRAIEFANSASYNTIDSCIIQTSITTTSTNFYGIYSGSGADTNNRITYNQIIGGESGIFWHGASAATKDSSLFFGNDITDFYNFGINIDYGRNIQASSNFIKVRYGSSIAPNAISMSNTDGACRIEKNHIDMQTAKYNHGINLYMCTASSVSHGIIANNFISCNTSSTGSQYGLYIKDVTYYEILSNSVNIIGGGSGSSASFHQNGSNVSFLNNIFNMEGIGYSFYTYTSSAIFNADYNCLYTNGAKIASWGSSLINLSDLQTASGKFTNSIQYHTIFKSPVDLHVNSIYLDGKGTNISSLVPDDFDGELRLNPPDIGADEFTLIPMDIGVSGINQPYGGIVPGNQLIEVALSNYDTAVLKKAWVKYSIDNATTDSLLWTGSLTQNASDQNVNLGTHNFVQGVYQLKAWSEFPNETYDNIKSNDTSFFTFYVCNPMSGTYTIGGTSADFSTFYQAIESLNNCGVSGPVTFYVADGVYNEQLILSCVEGASATNTITFTQAPTNSTGVQIQHYASSQQDQATLYFDSAQFITFHNFNIKGTGTSYGTAVLIDHNSSNINIDSNIMEVNGTTDNHAVVIIRNSSFNTISQNVIGRGRTGISVEGLDATHLNNGNIIENNQIEEFKTIGVYNSFASATIIERNSINNSKIGLNVWGIANVNGNASINKNYIYISTTSNNTAGMYFNHCNGSTGSEVMVTNNAIVCDSGNIDLGIHVDSSSYINFYFNTASLFSTGTSSSCFKLTSATSNNIDLINNIFAMNGPGLSIDIQISSAVPITHHNCLYTAGTILAYWDGNRTSLASLQSASGKFTYSISELPLFVDYDNPHLTVKLSAQGTPITGITTDFDDDIRSATAPDMGGDEYTQLTNDGALTAIYAEDSCEGFQEIYVELRNDGTDTITTAEIRWRVNAIDQATFIWNGSLAPNDSIAFVIDSNYLTQPQVNYNVESYVYSVNNQIEINLKNDSVGVYGVTFFPDPIINFTNLNYQYCENITTVSLSATPTGGQFSGIAVSGNTFDPSNAGLGNSSIYYSVTDGNGCSNIDSTQILITTLPTVSIITPIKPNYCSYENSVNLNGAPFGGNFSGTGVNTSMFNPANAGTGNHDIIYTYTDAYGCTNSDTAHTAVSNPPTASLSALTTTCSNTQSVILSGGSPSGGVYQGNSINPSQGIFYPQIAGIGLHQISYIYTDAQMCSDTAFGTIRIVGQPNSNFNIPSSSCINDTVAISYLGNASNNAIFNYNFDNASIVGGSSSGPYQVKWNTAGVKQVSLSVSDSNCTSITNSQYINVISTLAMITPQGLTTVCYGDTVKLFANSGTNFHYQWYDSNGPLNGDTLIQFKAFQSGSYFCLVTPPTGCPAFSNTINVTIKPQITADFSLQTQACQGDTVSVIFNGTATGNANYNWNWDGATVVSGSGSGPYNVIWNTDSIHRPSLLISNNGCFSNIKEKSIYIIHSVATISALGNTSFCDGGSVNLLANSGPYNYQWYKNSQALSGANNAFYVSNQSGNYTVLTTDTLTNCSSMSSLINVTVNSTDFNLAFTANPTTFTSGPFNTTIINQTPNMASYYWVWNFGDGNTSSLISPSHTYAYDGTYDIKVVAQDINTGCYDTLIKNNYISCTGGNPNPCTIVASISPMGYTTLCQGDSINLTATQGNGYNYQWIHNNVLIPNSDSVVFTATQAGTYYVIISDSICSRTSPPFMLNNYPSIQPVIVATGTMQPCTNDSVMLSTNISYNNYSWSTGSSNANIYVKNTGYYQVSVTDNYGCNLTSTAYAISNSFLSPPNICIVGVDSANHNQIVWERQSNSLIDSFYVYRESNVANKYDKIGALAFSSNSIFVDTNSNPNMQAYRYKLASVDTCGGISLMSNYHKTIHLSINAGMNGSWNLIWDDYKGFNFGSYRIYRGNNGSNMTLLAQLPSTASSFTDLFPPSGTLYYEIEVINPNNCYPDSVYAKGKTNYNSSRSNRANNGGIQPQYLTADFTANIYTGQWPIQVSFIDASTGSPESWLWDFGDGNTSIIQNPKHTYNNIGFYTVTLKVCNSGICDTMIKTGLIHVLPNGLINIEANMSASIYPNPNKGNFVLEINSPSQQTISIQIFNTLGVLVYQEYNEVLGKFNKRISINELSNGVYILRIITKDKIIMNKRLIIQK